MGLLDEMEKEPENNGVGGLLGLMAQVKSEEPFYMVGRRPLNIYEVGQLLRKGSPSLVHEHFILNDGRGELWFYRHGRVRRVS